MEDDRQVRDIMTPTLYTVTAETPAEPRLFGSWCAAALAHEVDL